MLVAADQSNHRSPISQEIGFRVPEVLAFFGPGLREGPRSGLAGGSSFAIRAKGGLATAGSSLEGRCGPDRPHPLQTGAQTLKFNRCSLKPWLSQGRPVTLAKLLDFINVSFLLSKWKEAPLSDGDSQTPGPAPGSVKEAPSPSVPSLTSELWDLGPAEAVEKLWI